MYLEAPSEEVLASAKTWEWGDRRSCPATASQAHTHPLHGQGSRGSQALGVCPSHRAQGQPQAWIQGLQGRDRGIRPRRDSHLTPVSVCVHEHASRSSDQGRGSECRGGGWVSPVAECLADPGWARSGPVPLAQDFLPPPPLASQPTPDFPRRQIWISWAPGNSPLPSGLKGQNGGYGRKAETAALHVSPLCDSQVWGAPEHCDGSSSKTTGPQVSLGIAALQLTSGQSSRQAQE